MSDQGVNRTVAHERRPRSVGPLSVARVGHMADELGDMADLVAGEELAGHLQRAAGELVRLYRILQAAQAEDRLNPEIIADRLDELADGGPGQ